ncbi:MAG TPA: hypothetical protein VMT03_10045 [Polyangia bacterium]|nr:hypothetical protein [Polyangia bacterium]
MGLPVAATVLYALLGAEVRARDAVALEVEGACPDAASVQKVLGELLGTDELRGTATISDDGPRYRIQMAGATTATTLADPARDCAARARYAAAILTGDLHPHPQVFGPPVFTIEKGAVFDFAAGTGGTVWAPGAEFRGAFGSGPWSLVGSAGARGPATMDLGGGQWKAEILRFPLDVGFRLTAHWGRFRPWLTLGGSLTPTAIQGQDVVQSNRQWRVDPGTLVMAGATLRLFKRIGVAAALNVRWQPRPYQLQVAPYGTVGETPTWWLGISLSYTIDGRPSSP